MSIKIKSISIKNFLSVGNVTQAVDFTKDDLVLVLGENLDLGGNDSKNGVGKSTIANAISYALFGVALTKIKQDNLINKTNGKNMSVNLDFEKNGVNYRIERSRKPTNLCFLVNGETIGEEEKDEAQGDNRITQEEIEKVIGISRDMFNHIIALNTYSEPFLSMRAGEQRGIIEQLLGITKLSEKADKLKDAIKETKLSIKEEELRIKATQEANKRIEDNIKNLKVKSSAWHQGHENTIKDINNQILELVGLDIDRELQLHIDVDAANKVKVEVDILKNSAATIKKELKIYRKNLLVSEKQLSTTSEATICPTCSSELDSNTHEKIHKKFEDEVEYTRNKIKEKEEKLNIINSELSGITVPEVKETFYKNAKDAYDHKSMIESLKQQLCREETDTNPYIEQIDILKENGLQEISFDAINDLTVLKNHQEFLLKLLTNKDSFIRKKIIDQNLLYLNSRLSHYLEKVGLPHEVKFMSDLDVEISTYGKTFDFDNLSRGERTRLILSLSWSFRDVYESLNDSINLLFCDELLDNGLDASGVNDAIAVFKDMSRVGGRNIFLISHRDELISRIDTILKVTKEGGFTSFDYEE